MQGAITVTVTPNLLTDENVTHSIRWTV